MVGWHHWLNGHEFEQTPGDSEEQGSLECCSSWGHKEADMTQQLNNSKGKQSQSQMIAGEKMPATHNTQYPTEYNRTDHSHKRKSEWPMNI